MSTSVHFISLVYPGAWLMTCSMKSSCTARRAGSVFSTSRTGRMLSTRSRAKSSLIKFSIWGLRALFPAYTMGSSYPTPRRGLGSDALISSAISMTWDEAPPSVPPASRIMSGLRFRILWIFWYGWRPSSRAITSMTMAPAPRAALLALSAVMDLIRPATIIWRPPPALLVVQ